MKRVIWGVILAVGLIVPIWMVATSSSPKEAPTQLPTAPAAPPPTTAAAPSPVAALPPEEQPVGEIFGMPVRRANYEFAKRVAFMFPQPWGAADLPADKREAFIWQQLILHYESFHRNIQPTDDEMDALINELLKNSKLPFTRKSDPDAYRRWLGETLYEDIPYFENQVRYLLQIRKLQDQVYAGLQPAVTEEELQEAFLNESHHVGGEMVVFDTKADAEALYQQTRSPQAWEKMKRKGKSQVRPVSLMTLEAYIDLWQIPKEQIKAFHAMEIGQVGPPMPFGNQWCVYRLLEKRTGDLKDFPSKRDSYSQKLLARKQYQGLHQWIDDLVKRANRTSLTETAAGGS